MVVEKLKIADSVDALNKFRRADNKSLFVTDYDPEENPSIKDYLADELIKKLEVKPSRESSILLISYKSNDTDLAALVANAFADVYQQKSIQLKVEPAQKAAEYLGDQTKRLREDLQVAQEKLMQYKQGKGLTSESTNLDVESDRLNELSTQLVNVQSQSVEATSRQQSTQGNADSSPDVAADPIVQNLKIQLSQAESKFSETAQRLGPSHPQYQSAQAELAKLRGQLKEATSRASANIGSTANIHQKRVAELKAALASQKERVLALNLSRGELSVLQRDVDTAQKALDSASQRLTQNTLQGNVTQADIAILTRAISPTAPVGPRVLLNMILSIFLGTLLGVGFGLLSEMLDRRVRSRDDVVELLGVPVFVMSAAKRATNLPSLFNAFKRKTLSAR